MKKWPSGSVKKAELAEEIEYIEHDLEQLKAQLAETRKHIDWHELKKEDKFEQLPQSRKRLVNTIKMIAYRAETANHPRRAGPRGRRPGTHSRPVPVRGRYTAGPRG